ncbi:MAG TPA: S1C family serine protease, partial [Anaerolineales bacterium]|nr:S1C family serine protease [Anaerolineales bacterium]
RGSGFIIDPAGIAVTNNHVVTGAALLKVWVGGESSPRNARVLGVSECSDLAVIDIDGDGYDYLDWHTGPIDVGMDMYIAGFPLGDPEYTLTKGVISKAKANGETSWSSVDSVVEYDATSNPGNSGGPVVTPDGKVLAVHYAGNASTRQAFGISKDIAGSVVEQLRTGKNLDSIGVNGQAVSNEDGSLTGVWVSSVQSGSPADQAGIQPGDIIMMLENLVLASDGTLSEYCDILRSHQPSDTLSLQILRWASNEVLEGQLNGRELEVAYTFGDVDDNTNANDNTSASTDVVNPNANESGDFYYYTEFDGDLGSWVYYLTRGEEQDFTANTSNSRMRVEIDDTYTYVYFMYDEYEYTDTWIDTTAENLGRNNNNVSLICRESDLGWYEFNIANNGEYWIYWYDDVTEDGYVELWHGGSTLIKMGKDINEYTAYCVGDTLSLWINGVEVKTLTNKNLKSGRAGLSVSSFNVTPIIVEFDYFAVGVP